MNVKEQGAPGAAIALTTVLAPIAWGTTYVTITKLLPADRPLLVAAMRVVPAAIALLVVAQIVSPWRPHGHDWWRTGVLALFNFGLFFPLLAVAVYRLPGGVAAAAGGLQPLLVAGLTWLSSRRTPSRRDIEIACVAAVGVALVVVRPNAGIDTVGVLAALAANLSFATGVVLTKRFPAPPNRLAATAWQLLLGGALLVPLMLVVEGAPPPLSTGNLAGFAYLSLVGTALAFVLVVQRHPQAAHRCASAPRARRADHGSDTRLGRARSVALAAAAGRIRNHAECDRLRRDPHTRAHRPAPRLAVRLSA